MRLESVKKQAKDLFLGLQRRDPDALRRCHSVDTEISVLRPTIGEARYVIARKYGFTSWRQMLERIAKR